MQEYILYNEITDGRCKTGENKNTWGKKGKIAQHSLKIFTKPKTKYNHLQGAPPHPGAPHLEPEVELSLLPEPPCPFALAPLPLLPLPLPLPPPPPFALLPAVPPLAVLNRVKRDSDPGRLPTSSRPPVPVTGPEGGSLLVVSLSLLLELTFMPIPAPTRAPNGLWWA